MITNLGWGKSPSGMASPDAGNPALIARKARATHAARFGLAEVN
jgi:hypothetical protein